VRAQETINDPNNIHGGKMIDDYKNYADLAQTEREGKDYRRVVIPRGSTIAILAPHGGGIEAGTSEIAKALADETHSLYCFEGLKQRGNQRLHITSSRFDEPLCLELLRSADCAVAIHGCAGKTASIHVGGLDQKLSAEILAGLARAGFPAQADGSRHAGNHPDNICNRGLSGAGAQLEISEGMRKTLFAGLKQYERENPTAAFWKFVEVMRDILEQQRRSNCADRANRR
jgi:phage replication-related protein YjqB (UPF0714/DUF867 family)